MGGYQRYETYKDSGIKWLGKIPTHWEAKRFKFLISGSFQYGANEVAEIDDPELPRYIRITDVREDGSLKNDTFRSLPEHIAQNYLLEEGDILLARSGATVGKTFIYTTAWGRAAYAGYLIRARVADNGHSRFIYQFLQSNSYWEWVRSSFIQATIQNISAEKYANLWLPIPPLEEQKTIAHFLDYKTAQIDALIAKKASLLKKLAEKRSALISQAVTKGLDLKVPMKDSGVEWLGEIPAHYQLKRLKFVIEQIIDAEHKTAPYDADGEFLVVRTTNVRNGKLLLKNGKYVDKDTYEKWTTRAVPEPGDILFTREAPAGEACLVPEEPILCLGQRMVLFKFDHEKYDGYFLLNSIYSGIADDFVKSLSLGSTVSHFNMSDIGSIPLIIPPYTEQQKISQWLELYIGKFDAQAGKVKLGIQQLKEYRTALITNAVTGAIDVRNVPIPNDLKEAT
jgi:type I restriction enzyme, S subunit